MRTCHSESLGVIHRYALDMRNDCPYSGLRTLVTQWIITFSLGLANAFNHLHAVLSSRQHCISIPRPRVPSRIVGAAQAVSIHIFGIPSIGV